MNDAISNVEFSLISTPKAITFDDKVPIRNYDRIMFSDSLFKFYPYGEVYYKDSIGLIADKIFFVEGLEFMMSIGFPEIKDKSGKIIDGGYLSHNYFWSEDQINKIQIANNVSGDNVFILSSIHKRDDHPRSRAFNYKGDRVQTIKDILKNIILLEYPISSDKQFISNTSGFPYLTQCSQTNRYFIETLATIAYSSANDKSPFYSFINSQGEFYFMNLEDLFSQKPVAEYELAFTEDLMLSPKYIKDYRILFGGYPVNSFNYNKNFYRFKADGTTEKEKINIQQAIPKPVKQNEIGTDSVLLRNQYFPKTGSSHHYYGIENKNDFEIYKGYKNRFFRDSTLNYRFKIVVDFNPRAVSGKVINISLQKGSTTDKEKAQEYTGNWLICESFHHMSDQGKLYTMLTISKPRITLDKTHPFLGDFS